MSATLGLDTARAADPARYATGGSLPRFALRPASRDEVAEALRAATRDRLTVLPWGGGVALARGSAPAPCNVALDLSALGRVIEYEPDDFTCTVECGVTIAALRSLIAARSQELPLEGAHADRATLGGVLAANASGPRRLRFGAPRHRILGARFALGDGTLARTGGKVVKNVAGYAVHRLLCGSRGGLAVLIEASLKLAPAPERRLALVYQMNVTTLADAARWSFLPRLQPAFVTVVGCAAVGALAPRASDDTMVVVIGLEDDAPGVEEQRAKVVAALGEPARRLDGAEAVALPQALADLEERDGPRLSFTTADNTPAALEPLAGLAESRGAVFHAPAGRLHVPVAAARAQAVADLLSARGFALIEARGTCEIAPPVAPQTAVLELRRRVRDALDPGRRFALGDRWERGAI